MAAKPKPFVMPTEIGACADLLYRLKAERATLASQVKALEEREALIKNYIIETLPKTSTGVSGRVAHARVVTREVPRVEDWDLFYKYILKTKDFSLLQRRVGEKAVEERWEAQKQVPGVTPFTLVSVSITKV
jgi:hypothetical protein